MICNECKETGILNHAGGKEFWYCRTCKVEIQEERPKHEDTPAIDPLWPYFDSNPYAGGLQQMISSINKVITIESDQEQLEFEFTYSPCGPGCPHCLDG